ncbi:GFA family protein [Salaquimonas pukyongi]|uniref:GFA family protein n=1 Tax=Salaquimonas pukyongi TaxID=2712698 RepID=UPI00096BB4E6|nr:GFA family protein [Salaquimonas pukyongi]
MTGKSEHRGHCRCGAMVMIAAAEPVFSVYCHCDDCRRAAGAPVLAAVAFMKDAIDWQSAGSLKRHTNGTAHRLFCGECGSPVAQEHDSAADRTFFNTGFMDAPERYPPQAHTFEGEQLGWLELKDSLPRAKATLSIKRP